MANRFRKLRMEQMEAREMFSVTPISGLINTVGDQAIDGGGGTVGNIPVSQGLALSSRPGAPATLFLDFNGHHQIESWLGRSDFTTPAFDVDHDPTTFSPEEQLDIQMIWANVAEDFAPF